jgi:hypothetical protein
MSIACAALERCDGDHWMAPDRQFSSNLPPRAADAVGPLVFRQCADRAPRDGEPSRFDTTPSRPRAWACFKIACAVSREMAIEHHPGAFVLQPVPELLRRPGDTSGAAPRLIALHRGSAIVLGGDLFNKQQHRAHTRLPHLPTSELGPSQLRSGCWRRLSLPRNEAPPGRAGLGRSA